MTSVSHRELRNNSSDLLRAAARGESHTITNNGVPVARLVPLDARPVAPVPTKPAVRRGGFTALPRHRVAESVASALDELRAER